MNEEMKEILKEIKKLRRSAGRPGAASVMADTRRDARITALNECIKIVEEAIRKAEGEAE
jgi:hypothetical protein